jgi:putative ABC transport system permease protein
VTAAFERLLERVLGRLPIGWLQLTHNRTRFAAALAGVAFANILIFMQLGFLGAVLRSIALPYEALQADLIVSASDANTMNDGSPLPRQRMFEALAVEGVATAAPLYLAKLDWKQPDGTIRTLELYGIDPQIRSFRTPAISDRLGELARGDVALIDRRTRYPPVGLMDRIEAGSPYRFESRGRTIEVVGTFQVGGGFGADGYMVVSDQTFFRLFPQRAPGAPNHILLALQPGADKTAVPAALRAKLPAYDAQVRTIAEAAASDQRFQTTQRPVGIVFGFGVVIGFLVGLVIVYQVLSSDVADHIREYATFKAIGYPQRFFRSIVFEEAAVLALFGFLPGFVISLGLYAVVARAASLPVAMTAERAIGVLVVTLVMCAVSGAIATRRLKRAEPADLF